MDGEAREPWTTRSLSNIKQNRKKSKQLHEQKVARKCHWQIRLKNITRLFNNTLKARGNWREGKTTQQ